VRLTDDFIIITHCCMCCKCYIFTNIVTAVTVVSVVTVNAFAVTVNVNLADFIIDYL